MQNIVLKVEGMSCSHCENRIKKAVGNLTGVKSVGVSLQDKTVTVELDPTVLDAVKIRETIEHEGYDVVA
ncbi:copper chaperone [Sporobacter termitidis DSM 10068]|uniref:Copper chaperone CopZ n=1 Tax=Sporobacter termitidis DSM 10068 TaxID=1123282 RepID=A0A1M5Z1U4_9FIRM|nr:copper ion binding protein [Sporobacter termitidis]SHI18196.1 copper chaperone [Sporobacter termitidis DSM 10068]